MPEKQKIKKLKTYFEKREDIEMAFLFGSRAGKNRVGEHSDWDIAVYFTPEKKEPLNPANARLHGIIEWEEQDRQYPAEDRVWGDVMKILNTDEVDLVILNRCPANIADSAIRGLPLVIKNKWLYLEFMLLITRVAESFRQFVFDYYKISQRSHSLSQTDLERLVRTIDFLEKEMPLYSYFLNFNQKIYEAEVLKRHEVEKWLENILMATIDIAKILIGSRKQSIPDTYRQSVLKAIQLLDLPDNFTENFNKWVILRNSLVHEYLDIKWKRIKNFIDESEPYFQEFIKKAKEFLSNDE